MGRSLPAVNLAWNQAPLSPQFSMHDPHQAFRQANLDRVLEAESSGLGEYDALPIRVTLELTADCNLRCPHCEFTPPRAWKEKHDPHRILHLGLDDLRVFASKVFPHTQEIIPSVVGEPMMYPFWNEFLDLLEEYHVYAEIVTNGSYLTVPTLDRCGKMVSRFIISMDGATPSTFEYLRAPDKFESMIARLELLRDWRKEQDPEVRPGVDLAGVLTLQWVDELPEYVRIGHSMGIDNISIGHLIAYNSHWEESHPSRDPDRCDSAMQEAAAEARRLGIGLSMPKLFSTGEDISVIHAPAMEIIPKVATPPRPELGHAWCRYMWREMFIALNGDVSACCGNERPIVGNMREDFDPKALFMAPIMQTMRQGMVSGELHPACAVCPQLAMFGDLSYEQTQFEGTYGTLEGLRQEQKRDSGMGAPQPEA
jgi:MoaA/NifB/PqqE/SkfB family radical SAM enzyme